MHVPKRSSTHETTVMIKNTFTLTIKISDQDYKDGAFACLFLLSSFAFSLYKLKTPLVAKFCSDIYW